MNRSILIELTGYSPTLLCYLDQQGRRTVEEQIGLSAIWLYQWKQDVYSLKEPDIVEQACKEGRDWVVYSILDYTNQLFVNMVAKNAAQYGRRELLNHIIENGADDWNEIAQSAAYGGYKDIVEQMIKRGADYWEYIVQHAAEGGYKDIVEQMISRGANYWNWIACGLQKVVTLISLTI